MTMNDISHSCDDNEWLIHDDNESLIHDDNEWLIHDDNESLIHAKICDDNQ